MSIKDRDDQAYTGPGIHGVDDSLAFEIAKGIVKEKKLSQGQTISKKDILDYINKQGVSPMMLTNVAMFLRDSFQLTPTFDESKNPMANQDLISEIKCMMEGRETAPAKQEEDIAGFEGAFEQVVTELFQEAKDETEEAVIAALSLLPMETLEGMAALDAQLKDEHFEQIEECMLRGGEELFEQWLSVATRPHLQSFLPEHVQHELGEVSVLHLQRTVAGNKTPRPEFNSPEPRKSSPLPTGQKFARRRAAEAEIEKRGMHGAGVGKVGGEDPLASRQAPAEMPLRKPGGYPAQGHMVRTLGRDNFASKTQHRSALAKHTDSALGGSQSPLPADLVKSGKDAMQVAKNVSQEVGKKSTDTPGHGIIHSIKTGLSKAGSAVAAHAPGLFKSAVRGAGKLVAGIGKLGWSGAKGFAGGLARGIGRGWNHQKATWRMNHPMQMHMLSPNPSSGEQAAADSMMRAKHMKNQMTHRPRQGSSAPALHANPQVAREPRRPGKVPNPTKRFPSEA